MRPITGSTPFTVSFHVKFTYLNLGLLSPGGKGFRKLLAFLGRLTSVLLIVFWYFPLLPFPGDLPLLPWLA